jgi:TFIIF-interacting CTD phosphatase-like protein
MIDEVQVIIDTPTKQMLEKISSAIEDIIESKLDISSIGESLQETISVEIKKRIGAIQQELIEVRKEIGDSKKDDSMRAVINALNKTNKQW